MEKRGGVSMIEGNPKDNGVNKKESVSREALAEQWGNAPEGVIRYPAGKVLDTDGNVAYEYAAGARLWIGNELEVMDSCQRPWVVETVDKAFNALGPKPNVKVLERGFGLGLIAGEIIDRLRPRGGSYTVIELNKQVADFAKTKWTQKQSQIDKARATSEIGGRYNGPNVSFEIIEGDAVEETEKLAESGERFDIIISDTFPLSEAERSINDLLDLETLVKCLNPNGVFAFFGYHSGFQGGMNERQRNLVEKYFEQVSRTIVKGINPPPDYKYFNPENGPVVRELPVIICTKPRIQATA